MKENTTINNYLWVLEMARLTNTKPQHHPTEKQLVSNIQHFFKRCC